ncbi:hypothetical protein [Acidisoma sp. C75]
MLAPSPRKGRQVGIVKVQSRLRDKPSAAWMAILPLLGTGVGKRFHLARFARYCSQAGVEPEAVDDGIILHYERDLTEHSLSAEPKRAAREVAGAWNAARATHPAWPQPEGRALVYSTRGTNITHFE